MENTCSFYEFDKDLYAQVHPCMINETIEDIWCGCCEHYGNIHFSPCNEYCLKVGEMHAKPIPDGSEYLISVNKSGIFINAINEKALFRAMMVLMMQIEPAATDSGSDSFRIPECELASSYVIDTRMIHFCIFPETTYPFIQKCIRLAGLMQYTHIILEFWGTLEFDCLKELAWPSSFTKSQVSSLVKEITEMGMEAIPMFNHLGHASGCRESGGKHVVLDQNPRLASLFSYDGWSWNIGSRKVKSLLADIRRELYELFPSCRYFHLGCDEVYSYGRDEEGQRLMREYLSDLCEEVHKEGKCPIVWGDMLLNKEMLGVGPEYFCLSDTPEYAEMLLEAIPKYVVIADWHYNNTAVPVETSVFLKSKGFDVLGTPWFKYDNCVAHVNTVYKYDLAGVLVTTWHTLAQNMPQIVYDALICGAHHSPWAGTSGSQLSTETAALLRKVQFVHGNYSEAGWTDEQIFKQARATV